MSGQRKVINHHQLHRIFLEAVEIAFQECAENKSNFGEDKICFIVNSLVPTGYVLGTSYWFLYTDRKRGGKPFCVCERYGRVCKHKVDDKLDANFTDYGDKYYFPAIMKDSFVAPADTRLVIEQEFDIVNVMVLFDHLALIFHDKRHSRFDVVQTYKPEKPIFFRFRIEYPKGPLLDSFTLRPHPLSNFRYGKMVSQLKKELLPLLVFCPNKMDISEEFIEKFTIMPESKNDYIPGDIFAMAPISQELFKGELRNHKAIDYFIDARLGTLEATRRWHFMKSIDKFVENPKDGLYEHLMRQKMLCNISKGSARGMLGAVSDELADFALVDVNDAGDLGQRLMPVLVMHEKTEEQPMREQVPPNAPKLNVLKKCCEKNPSNTKCSETGRDH